MPALYRDLAEGVAALGISLSANQLQQQLNFLDLLSKWNKTYNLTAIKNPKDMVTHHILDSLSIYKYIDGKKILDVGTGGGLPGIPLAIAYPEKQFILVDSVGKKIRFIKQAAHSLGLKNVTAIHTRVEDLEEKGFDLIMSRAVGKLKLLYNLTKHLANKETNWLLMKGQYPESEVFDIGDGDKSIVIEPVSVPGLDGNRHIVFIKNLG